MTDPWEAHEHPGRPLDSGAMLCSCTACWAAIEAEARERPRSVLCLKTNSDRIVVTAEYLVETMTADSTLERLLYVPDDYVRSIFVPVDGWLAPPQRWWSHTCHEADVAAGRRPRRHKVAKRQSAMARRRRQQAAAEAARSAAPPTPVKFVPLATAAAPARAKHRELLIAAAKWGLAQGQPFDLDVLGMICGAVDEGPELEGPADVTRWTRTGVNRLLSVDAFNWCSFRWARFPEGVPEAFWRFLDFLADTHRLHPASDPLAELRKPLRCYGGLDQSGSRRAEGEPTIPCECYITYRGPRRGEFSALQDSR